MMPRGPLALLRLWLAWPGRLARRFEPSPAALPRDAPAPGSRAPLPPAALPTSPALLPLVSPAALATTPAVSPLLSPDPSPALSPPLPPAALATSPALLPLLSPDPSVVLSPPLSPDPSVVPSPARPPSTESALYAAAEGVAQWDSDGRLVAANAGVSALFGLRADDLAAGLAFHDFVLMLGEAGVYDGSEPDEIYTMATSLVRRRSAVTYDLPLSGGRAVRVSYRPLDDGGWVSSYQDVTEHRRIQAEVSFMQHHDPLTRLANRRAFKDRLHEALARVRDVAVLAVDLDRFKQVNDTLGTAAGDTLLQHVARRLNNCVRPTDSVARLGSDDFAVVLAPGSHEAAAAASRHLMGVLASPFEIGGRTVVTGASVGIAIAPADGADADTVLRKADLALHAAKAEGPGLCRFFEPAMEERMRVHWEIESALRDALLHNGLVLFFQPLVSIGSRAITGFEALTRWQHPRRGLVSPDVFIPVAEATRQIIPLGAWSIRQACQDLALLPLHLRMAVNLSAIQFGSDELVPTVREALADSGLPPGRLELEVTETTVMRDPARARAMLDSLRDLGVRIVLDDFGTGYSSLAYIRDFPFDKVKIDKSFIDDLGRRRGAEAIVRAVTGIAASLGIETVAEGVETEDQFRRVAAAGCDTVQGFLFGRPVPLELLPATLAAIDAQQLDAAGRLSHQAHLVEPGAPWGRLTSDNAGGADGATAAAPLSF